MSPDELCFSSAGERCAGWHFVGTGEEFLRDGARPCVVMAHGFGGTRDTGLLGFARAFSEAGLDVLLFDYRGFGASAGDRRQHVSFRAQRRDYLAAIEAARRLPGVDPGRIVLWGTSYSGGHVLPVAVADGRIAAVISMTPAMDGAAALWSLVKSSGPVALVKLTGHALRDLGRTVAGREPHLIPLAAEPGRLGVLTAPGALGAYSAVAGPTWRNEVCARVALEVAFNRPTRCAARVSCPLLVQIGEMDHTVPASAARRAARKAGIHATARSYPLDHFDVYDGGAWHDRVVADQLEFLRAQLAAGGDHTPRAPRRSHRRLTAVRCGRNSVQGIAAQNA